MLNTLLVLEMGSLPIKIVAMERVVKHMFKVQESLVHFDFLESRRCMQKIFKRRKKAKFYILVGYNI